jgi:hypothetical protein
MIIRTRMVRTQHFFCSLLLPTHPKRYAAAIPKSPREPARSDRENFIGIADFGDTVFG